MSNQQAFRQLAIGKGILSPKIQYDRRAGDYTICITIPASDGVGFVDAGVGVYQTLAQAKDQLSDDIAKFLLRYPDAKDKVASRYHKATDSQNTFEQSNTDDRRASTYQLLQALQNEEHPYYQDDLLAQLATDALAYIISLEAQLPPTTAKGTYESKLPEQPKKAIEWEQPIARQHPVYTFDLICPYCGDEVTLERHSPHAPKHCDKDECGIEHRRTLARERKRRQRERERNRMSRNDNNS